MAGRPEDEQEPNKAEIVDLLNAAFRSGDVDRIAQAIGAAARLHNIADVAKRARLSRPSLYRAFAGKGSYPNLTTVVHALEAMGLGLRVARIKKLGAKPSRLNHRASGD